MILLAFIVAVSSICAGFATKENILVSHKKEIDLIENYFNSLTTFEANFVQNYKHHVSHGVIKIKRPEKFYVDYLSGNTPVKLIVNGGVFKYYDKKLDQESSLPVGKTAISIITQKHFSLASRDIDVIDISNTEAAISITLQKPSRKDEGTFKVTFRKIGDGIELSEIQIQDIHDSVTITISDIKHGAEIADSVFVMRNKNYKKLDLGE